MEEERADRDIGCAQAAKACASNVCIFVNNVTRRFGHVAIGLQVEGRAFEIYNYAAQDNRTFAIGGAIDHIYRDEAGRPATWDEVAACCRAQTLRLTNSYILAHNAPATGRPYFFERFNRCLRFTLPAHDVEALERFAAEREATPGRCNGVLNNCLTFVIEAFAATGYAFLDARGKVKDRDLLVPPVWWFDDVRWLEKDGVRTSLDARETFYEA